MAWKNVGQKQHYSWSQINMFRRCPLQYKFRYVDGLRRPPTSPLILGTSVHKGVEINMKEKFKTKKPAKLNSVLDAFSTTFDAAKKECDFEGKNPGTVKDMGVAMSKAHYEKIAPSLMPMAEPELFFSLVVPEVKIPIIGYIDVVAKVAGGDGVGDTKTTGRAKKQFDVDSDGQLTIYDIARREIFKKKPLSLWQDVIVGTSKGVTTQRLMTRRTDVERNEMLRTIQKVAAGIEAGFDWPCNNPMTCSWCGYADECPSMRNAKTAMLAARGE